jgi:hypothetical protein
MDDKQTAVLYSATPTYTPNITNFSKTTTSAQKPQLQQPAAIV